MLATDHTETTRTSVDVRGFFQSDVKDQSANLQLTRYDWRWSTPVWKNAQNSFDLVGQVKTLDLETRAILPDTFEKLPNSLWDVNFGGVYRHQLNNDWTLGGAILIGSASDRPFQSASEWTINADGFLRVPINEHDAWLFTLNVSNTREFEQYVPIPGLAYEFQRGKLNGLIGSPLTRLSYRPTDRWQFDLTYFLVRNIHVETTYRMFESVRLFVAFDWDTDVFLRRDRPEHDDRLFFYEKRVMGGFRWQVDEQTHLTLSAGYAFDRFIFEADEFDNRGQNRINIADGAVVQMRFNVAF
jgi:hypothetical protein